MVAIYALSDESGRVRYVGKANDPDKRLASHFRDAQHRNTPICCWLRKRTRSQVTLTVIEWCEDWKARERYWIEKYRAKGKILNLADGGDQPQASLTVNRRNAMMATKSRCATPFKARVYLLKKRMGHALRAGELSPAALQNVRIAVAKAPQLFGSLRKWL